MTIKNNRIDDEYALHYYDLNVERIDISYNKFLRALDVDADNISGTQFLAKIKDQLSAGMTELEDIVVDNDEYGFDGAYEFNIYKRCSRPETDREVLERLKSALRIRRATESNHLPFP